MRHRTMGGQRAMPWLYNVPAVSYSYPADVQNGTANFGLSLLRSAYSGNCLKVRRSSDDTTQDIGFVSTYQLDTASLLSFCSGTNGFIDTWYDQSGNSRDMTQSTLSLQPKIVTSGALTVTINGHAACNFQSQHLVGTTATSFCSNTEFTVFSVFNVSTIAGTASGGSFYQDDILWGDNGGWIAGACRKDAIGSQPYWMAGCNNDSAEQTIALTTNYVTVASHTGGTCYTYVNSQTSGANKSVSDSNMTGSLMRIGQTPFDGSIQDGNIAAVLFYSATVSSGNLDSIGAALASYYGVSWS